MITRPRRKIWLINAEAAPDEIREGLRGWDNRVVPAIHFSTSGVVLRLAEDVEESLTFELLTGDSFTQPIGSVRLRVEAKAASDERARTSVECVVEPAGSVAWEWWSAAALTLVVLGTPLVFIVLLALGVIRIEGLHGDAVGLAFVVSVVLAGGILLLYVNLGAYHRLVYGLRDALDETLDAARQMSRPPGGGER